MKTISRISVILMVMLALVLALPTRVSAQSNGGDQLVFGGTFVLHSGEIVKGNLIVFGGSATVEMGATIEGDVTLTGGTLEISGTVNGDISAIGGTVKLTDTARVNGALNTLGGYVDKSNAATIQGGVNSAAPGQLNLKAPINLPALPAFGSIFKPVAIGFLLLFKILTIAALALLIGLLLPEPTARVARAITSQPLVTGGIGLLSVIVAPVLILLVTITIIFSPIGVLGLLVLIIAVLFGWIAFGYEIGERIALLFKAHWAAPVSAAVGTLVLSGITGAFALIPCVGWIIGVIVGMVGLGGVVLTRFGTRSVGVNLGSLVVVKPPPPSENIPPAEGNVQ